MKSIETRERVTRRIGACRCALDSQTRHEGSVAVMRALSYFVLLCVLGAVPSLAQSGDSRVHKLEELAWPQIDALDRERTMFILPIGMIEEHGPHLPVASDTFGVEYEAAGVSKRVSAALPQWHVVMMPTIHYGETGANEIGGDFVHPGTYGIRHSTLRSLVADVGAQVAQNGFKWIFVMTGHASPSHGIAVNDACDFVSESFNVSTLHVSGLFRADAAIQSRANTIALRHFSATDIASFGMDVHAGVGETSVNLALRPILVHRGYKKLPPQGRAHVRRTAGDCEQARLAGVPVDTSESECRIRSGPRSVVGEWIDRAHFACRSW
jgi:creatinine amidohydrolase/Fe(II)-dependent formamide hydrolase-like protein